MSEARSWSNTPSRAVDGGHDMAVVCTPGGEGGSWLAGELGGGGSSVTRETSRGHEAPPRPCDELTGGDVLV